MACGLRKEYSNNSAPKTKERRSILALEMNNRSSHFKGQRSAVVESKTAEHSSSAMATTSGLEISCHKWFDSVCHDTVCDAETTKLPGRLLIFLGPRGSLTQGMLTLGGSGPLCEHVEEPAYLDDVTTLTTIRATTGISVVQRHLTVISSHRSRLSALV